MRVKLLIILSVIICLLVGCSSKSDNINTESSLGVSNSELSKADSNLEELMVDPNAEPIPKAPLEETVVKTVAIPGWNVITIPANYSEVYVDFYNPESNTDLYYLTFEWRLLNENGYDVIYKSDLMKPGEHTKKIALSRSFEAGEYETVIFVQPYKMNDNSPTNNANMNTKLVVR